MGYEINAEEATAAATSKGSFNVFEFVQGAVTPDDAIFVYTDANAALKLAKIYVAEKERNEKGKAEGFGLADESDEVVDEDVITELHDKLTASKLTFNMKGISPENIKKLEGDIKKVHEDIESEEYNELFNHTLIARTIVSVENPSGELNTDKWTAKMVKGFLPTLYVSEANKIYNSAAELSYVGAIFDRAVSADFS